MLTDEQNELVKMIVDWYNKSDEQVFEYSGRAGTGKTTVSRTAINSLGLLEDEVAPMAYTGAASIVLRTKGFKTAKTIHSWMYKPTYVTDESTMDTYLNKPKKVLKFIPVPLPESIKLIFIDEASFVPMSMKNEILKRGIKVLCCGDLHQLPPVNDNPAFLNHTSFELTQIMRQNENSGIVYIANKILDGSKLSVGHFGNVDIIYKDEVTDKMLLDSEMILCGLNITRYNLNRSVRELNGIDSDLKIPQHGERLICRKNNWNLNVDGISMANGLTGVVEDYPSMHALSNKGKTFKIKFKPIMFNMSFKSLTCNYDFFLADSETKKRIKNSKNKAIYPGNLMELSYVITTHLSQGSEFKNGVYISEGFSGEIHKNLDYTAITRFKEKAIIAIDRHKYY